LTGRYIIGRESPYTANENPEPLEPVAGDVCVSALAVPRRLGTTGTAASARSMLRRLRPLGELEEEDIVPF
jgi:hypothetical protein